MQMTNGRVACTAKRLIGMLALLLSVSAVGHGQGHAQTRQGSFDGANANVFQFGLSFTWH